MKKSFPFFSITWLSLYVELSSIEDCRVTFIFLDFLLILGLQKFKGWRLEDLIFYFRLSCHQEGELHLPFNLNFLTATFPAIKY